MTLLNPSNLREVRRVLGRSQEELASLLSVSTRAVQSYEQGWRPVPAHVQRCASLLLFLDWRRRNGGVTPCWEIRRCSAEVRAKCPVHELDAGDVCWLLVGCRCRDRRPRSREAQMARCRSCEVMRQWLKTELANPDGRAAAPKRPRPN